MQSHVVYVSGHGLLSPEILYQAGCKLLKRAGTSQALHIAHLQFDLRKHCAAQDLGLQQPPSQEAAQADQAQQYLASLTKKPSPIPQMSSPQPLPGVTQTSPFSGTFTGTTAFQKGGPFGTSKREIY